MDIKINSLYVCVKDMSRAVEFYEKLLEMKPIQEDDVYSVFDIEGFRYGLFAYEKMKEKHLYGSNCLPSFTVDNIELFMKKLKKLKCEIVFPLTIIGENYVLEFVDSEGNHIEVTSKISYM